PALIAINDGPFTHDDETAIQRLGLSAKPSQQPTIGKFGLGLKSVFHLCEAFFYVHKRSRKKAAWQILNPWFGVDGAVVHQAWETNLSAPETQMVELAE